MHGNVRAGIPELLTCNKTCMPSELERIVAVQGLYVMLDFHSNRYASGPSCVHLNYTSYSNAHKACLLDQKLWQELLIHFCHHLLFALHILQLCGPSGMETLWRRGMRVFTSSRPGLPAGSPWSRACLKILQLPMEGFSLTLSMSLMGETFSMSTSI